MNLPYYLLCGACVLNEKFVTWLNEGQHAIAADEAFW